MAKTLDVQIVLKRLPLSRVSVSALRNIDRYDLIVLTSKNAARFFLQELRGRKIPPPPKQRIVIVGPRNDLLKLRVRGKRILFPRSAIAPYDIIHKLRARGAVVYPLLLYTTKGTMLSSRQKKSILNGEVSKLSFRSPSAILGLARQFRGKERLAVLSLPAICIGKTTARAARETGFKKVTLGRIL